MKKLKITIISAIILFSMLTQTFAQEIKNKSEKQHDKYGRLITEGEDKIEYPFDESLQELARQKNQPTQKDIIARDSEEILCEPVWKQAVMGSCIGLNSMYSGDIDQDGRTEIICSGGSGFGGGRFWYILEYNETSQNYDFQWVSREYTSGYPYDNGVSTISCFDIENDGHDEIVCGLANGDMEIYDAETMSLTLELSYTEDQINGILLADADNDGAQEIVYACDDGYTYLIETDSYTVEHQIQYSSDHFAFGEVNGDEMTDLVYSNGEVISYDGLSVTEIWDFNDEYRYEGYVELSDIDSDGMDEIVFARYWYNLFVYDCDLQALKYQIESDLDIDALLLADVNGDGIDEILYGDGQWGNIYCHDAVTTSLIWDIYNPEHGTTEINVADVDNDEQLEVLWGSGCSSTGSDHLFIHEIPSCNFEWQSKHLDPPFYTVEVADVDDDETIEIVTVSYESNSGYDSGILTIFNAEDYSMEWQSGPNFFPSVWTGIYAMDIIDIDEDGQTEIVVAAGQTYTGQMWIINGSSHTIESSYVFWSEDFDEFRAMGIGDVDSDDELECVVGEDNKLHVIDPSDYSVEWTSGSLSSGAPYKIAVANVDSDPNNEIIACYGKIYIIDGITHQQTETANSSFTNFDIYDIDNDGINDIICCSSDGTIAAINGQNQQYSILLETELELDAIKIQDLTGDSDWEYVYTAAGSVYFRNQDGRELNTEPIASHAGKYDGFKLADYDDDGKYEIFTGTSFIVAQLDEICYMCIDFDLEMHGTDVSCNPPGNGTVEVIPSGGTEPYSYTWDTGDTTAQVSGLEAGTYSVTVTDALGCQLEGEVSIDQAYLTTTLDTKKVGCTGADDGEAWVEVTTGHEPFEYYWSTGNTNDTITGLAVGEYWVEVTDSLGCTSSHDFSIVQDSIVYAFNYNSINCYGYNNGEAWVEIQEGIPPFDISWSNGQAGSYVEYLPAGDYSVTITDALSCSHTTQFTITEPEEFSAVATVTPDDAETPEGDGTASLEVTGGVPPYYYQWNDPLSQTNNEAISLVAGDYQVVVEDLNGCMILVDVTIPTVNAIGENGPKSGIELFPNPADQMLTLKLNAQIQKPVKIELSNVRGLPVQCKTMHDFNRQEITMDVSHLPAGLYFIRVYFDNEFLTGKVEIY